MKDNLNTSSNKNKKVWQLIHDNKSFFEVSKRLFISIENVQTIYINGIKKICNACWENSDNINTNTTLKLEYALINFNHILCDNKRTVNKTDDPIEIDKLNAQAKQLENLIEDICAILEIPYEKYIKCSNDEQQSDTDEKLQFATIREKEAYIYHQEGMSYKKISERMNINTSRAGQLVKSAERRIRNYEAYCERHKEEIEKFTQLLDVSISQGEGNLIYDLLQERIKYYEKEFKIRHDSTNPYREVNKSKLPYEYFLFRDLYEKIAEILDKPLNLI